MLCLTPPPTEGSYECRAAGARGLLSAVRRAGSSGFRRRFFVTTYTAVTDAERAAMLAAIGVDSIDDLFADVPEQMRLDRALALPAGMAEQDVYAHLSELAARNVSAEDELTFL